MANTRANSKRAGACDKLLTKNKNRKGEKGQSPKNPKRGKTTSKNELQVQTETSHFVFCAQCGKKVKLNSSGLRVHKFRYHRNVREAAVTPVPEASKSVPTKVNQRQTRNKREMYSAIAKSSIIVPVRPAVETNLGIKNGLEFTKLINRLQAAYSDSTADGEASFKNLLLQCNIALNTYHATIGKMNC